MFSNMEGIFNIIYESIRWNLSCKKDVPNQKLKNKQLQNNFKLLKNSMKGLNSCDFVEIDKMFSKNFYHLLYYSTGTLSAEHLFSEHLLLDTCFTVN